MARVRESLEEMDARGLRYDVAFARWREAVAGGTGTPAWVSREFWATHLGPARAPAPGDAEAARAFLLGLSEDDAFRLGVWRQREEAKAQAPGGEQWLARWLRS